MTLYFRVPQPDPSAPEQLKKRTYCIPRKDAFITLLQDNLKRFKGAAVQAPSRWREGRASRRGSGGQDLCGGR